MIDAEPNSLGFVLTQEACAEFYITREIEKDLRGRITAVLDGLCSDAGVKFGESATVSIFASTVVPMPGILEKINGVGLNESVLSTLPDEAAQKAWALHLQLMKAFACELYVSSQHFTDLENEATGKYGVDEIEKLSVEALRELCAVVTHNIALGIGGEEGHSRSTGVLNARVQPKGSLADTRRADHKHMDISRVYHGESGEVRQNHLENHYSLRHGRRLLRTKRILL